MLLHCAKPLRTAGSEEGREERIALWRRVLWVWRWVSGSVNTGVMCKSWMLFNGMRAYLCSVPEPAGAGC